MAKCQLDGCNREARKKFCCNRHKDRYHNLKNPRGIYAHLKGVPMVRDGDPNDTFLYDEHPFSGEALGQDD